MIDIGSLIIGVLIGLMVSATGMILAIFLIKWLLKKTLKNPGDLVSSDMVNDVVSKMFGGGMEDDKFKESMVGNDGENEEN